MMILGSCHHDKVAGCGLNLALEEKSVQNLSLLKTQFRELEMETMPISGQPSQYYCKNKVGMLREDKQKLPCNLYIQYIISHIPRIGPCKTIKNDQLAHGHLSHSIAFKTSEY